MNSKAKEWSQLLEDVQKKKKKKHQNTSRTTKTKAVVYFEINPSQVFQLKNSLRLHSGTKEYMRIYTKSLIEALF